MDRLTAAATSSAVTWRASAFLGSTTTLIWRGLPPSTGALPTPSMPSICGSM